VTTTTTFITGTVLNSIKSDHHQFLYTKPKCFTFRVSVQTVLQRNIKTMDSCRVIIFSYTLGTIIVFISFW